MHIIFKQDRVGYNDKIFKIYKFRTMDENENITRIGRLLRITGLDEIAQIVNIFKGDLTLVGPRPLTPWDHKKFRGFPLTVKPGLTGWWQIHGRIQKDIWFYDTQYIHLKRKWGFLLDLYICIKTIPLVIFAKHG